MSEGHGRGEPLQLDSRSRSRTPYRHERLGRFLTLRACSVTGGLAGEEGGVGAAARDQLGVRAALGDATVGEDDDLVGAPRERQAMGDEQERAVAEALAHPLEGRLLGLGVERCGGFVEQQEGGVVDERAGEGDPLPLAGARLVPALEPSAENGVPRRRQRADPALDARGVRRALERVLPGRAGRRTEGDVVARGELEASEALRQHSEEPAHLLRFEASDVHAVERDRARGGVGQAGEQPEQSRFARAVLPHERGDPAPAQLEVHLLEGRALRAGVAEADPLAAERARCGRQRLVRPGFVVCGDRRAQVEHRFQALEVKPLFVQPGEAAGELLQGRASALEQAEVEHEAPGGRAAGADQDPGRAREGSDQNERVAQAPPEQPVAEPCPALAPEALGERPVARGERRRELVQADLGGVGLGGEQPVQVAGAAVVARPRPLPARPALGGPPPQRERDEAGGGEEQRHAQLEPRDQDGHAAEPQSRGDQLPQPLDEPPRTPGAVAQRAVEIVEEARILELLEIEARDLLVERRRDPQGGALGLLLPGERPERPHGEEREGDQRRGDEQAQARRRLACRHRVDEAADQEQERERQRHLERRRAGDGCRPAGCGAPAPAESARERSEGGAGIHGISQRPTLCEAPRRIDIPRHAPENRPTTPGVHPMLRESDVLLLVQHAYAAAEDPAAWPAFLDRFRAATKSQIASIFYQDLGDHRSDVSAAVGFDPRFAQLYQEHYSSKNVYMQNPAVIFPGSVCDGARMCPTDILLRSEYYNDFLRPMGVLDACGAILFVEDRRTAVVTALRSRRAPRYGDEELRLTRALVPHLQAALRINRRIAVLEQERAALREAADRLPVGVLLVASNGRVVEVNQAARSMIESRDGLRVGREGLAAERAAETRALRGCIARATAASRGEGLGVGGWVAVSRPSGKRPYHVLVTPLHGQRLVLGEPHSLAAIFVTDPELAEAPPAEALRAAYGLTPAECAVAVALARGETLRSLADALGISINTARTHLAHIFDKTGVRRQSDLARLLARDVLAPEVHPAQER
jgi:DNA-binding CsgD family transcriptional regulator/PAS domain-containing protein